MICLVTDRRRRPVVEQAAAAAAAGIDLVQIRERDLGARELFDLVVSALAVARGTHTRIIVNDRLDVALAAGAHGVHLRGDSVPPHAARSISPPGFLIGRSVHNRAEAETAGPHCDYLIAGTVYPTPSKPGNTAVAGIGGLRAICQAVDVPVLAIGGISADRLGNVREAGAAGIAAISWFDGATRFDDIVSSVKAAFDSSRAASYDRPVRPR
jgi:thiamine-phosphate pyrophosphorylase